MGSVIVIAGLAVQEGRRLRFLHTTDQHETRPTDLTLIGVAGAESSKPRLGVNRGFEDSAPAMRRRRSRHRRDGLDVDKTQISFTRPT